MNPETHSCDCGYTWRHGHSGTHLCGPQYRATIERQAKEIAALKATEPVAMPNDGLVPRSVDGKYVWLEGIGAVSLDYSNVKSLSDIQDAATPVVNQGAIDAAFSEFCEREGYPSDGPMDSAFRKIFQAGIDAASTKDQL